MIRVLNIQETIGYGGVEQRRLSLAKLLDKEKFELKIICTKTEGLIADKIRSNGVEVIPIGLLRSPFQLSQHKKVIKIISEFKPHIIHGAVFEGVTMAALNGFFKRVPIIILEETSDPKNRNWKGNFLMKILTLPSDKVIAVSPGVMEYLSKTLYLSKNKTLLINNGVKIPTQSTQIEIEDLKLFHSINKECIVIGSVGRMLYDEHKRYSDLIKAFAILIKKGLNTKLILVCGGHLIDTYKKLTIELNVHDHVIFTGYQNNPDKYYAIFDIFSLVSAYEAFGLVLAEAMLHKLPVVATKVGGMQYIVDDGETGFLVEKYDIDAIAQKLEILCLDANLRKEMGYNGYKKALDHYTEERYVKDIEKLYFELIQKKKVILS